MTSMTVSEAFAIVVADEALGFLADARQASGRSFSAEERTAWEGLVAAANNRIAEFQRRES